MEHTYKLVSDLPRGVVLWEGDDIIGVVGITVPDEYFDGYCYFVGHIDYEYVGNIKGKSN